jgi:cell division protein ZapA (FtsZ GTPase activity inhibitor)
MKTLEFTIWGQTVRLNSTQGEEFIRYVADYLNNKLKEVYESDPTLVSTQAASVRAACQVAAELFTVNRQLGEAETRVEQIEELLKNCYR